MSASTAVFRGKEEHPGLLHLVASLLLVACGMACLINEYNRTLVGVTIRVSLSALSGCANKAKVLREYAEIQEGRARVEDMLGLAERGDLNAYLEQGRQYVEKLKQRVRREKPKWLYRMLGNSSEREMLIAEATVNALVRRKMETRDISAEVEASRRQAT
jgi:polyhydroxyalkanoate synthesis regulator phasin